MHPSFVEGISRVGFSIKEAEWFVGLRQLGRHTRSFSEGKANKPAPHSATFHNKAAFPAWA